MDFKLSVAISDREPGVAIIGDVATITKTDGA